MLKELTDALLALMQAEAARKTSESNYRSALRRGCETIMRWKRTHSIESVEIAKAAKIGPDRVCRHIHLQGYLSSQVVSDMLKAAIHIHNARQLPQQ